MEKRSGMSDEDVCDFHALRQKLGDPGPMRPRSYFALNNRSLATLVVTFFTYSIILMQFKQSSN